MNIVLQGPEQYFWKGTEAGWMGCYDFPRETWAGDGSVHKGVMGAGSVCFQRPGRDLEFRVGREEEGTSSLRPELVAIARTLQAIPLETDLLYLCDSEAALNRVSRWIGVVYSRAFFFFFPCNHIINIKIKEFFFRRSKRLMNISRDSNTLPPVMP